MSAAAWALGAVIAIVAATVLAGTFGLRRARTTGDFYVRVPVGVAALERGGDQRGVPVGGRPISASPASCSPSVTTRCGTRSATRPGYLVLLVLVAAPLRRSGAYTLPDFVQIRLGSQALRRLASALVVLIGLLYLVPQMQGASLTLRTQTGAPVWAGGLVVAVVVVGSVVVGGMRSITFAQAMQFWVKFVALVIPALALLAVWLHRDGRLGDGFATASEQRTVTLQRAETVTVPRAQRLTVDGRIDARAVSGRVDLTAGRHRLGAGTSVTLHRGDVVPVVSNLPDRPNASWLRPLGSGQGHPLYTSLSLIVAICLGTMGLPHVLVRFYTNADGRDARRTTLIVLALLSLFYLLPTVFGALGRRYVAHLLLTGDTDATVLALPHALIGGDAGNALGALVTAGAFAAFLSTASGLTVSIAGVVSQDLLRPLRRSHPGATPDTRARRIRRFRVAALLAVTLPYLLSLLGRDLGLAAAVGLAFAVAAATFCPLLVLGIWWPRLTTAGAGAGVLVGGGLAGTAVVVTLAAPRLHGWAGPLLAQPAAWAVPISVVVTVVGSLVTADRVPRDVGRVMLRLHAPEHLGPPDEPPEH